jgi:hypothetical protein
MTAAADTAAPRSRAGGGITARYAVRNSRTAIRENGERLESNDLNTSRSSPQHGHSRKTMSQRRKEIRDGSFHTCL